VVLCEKLQSVQERSIFCATVPVVLHRESCADKGSGVSVYTRSDRGLRRISVSGLQWGGIFDAAFFFHP
jgi:hypothetical protein